MALLRSILVHKPPEWDDMNYQNCRYVRITLQTDSAEYNEIAAEFVQKFGDREIIQIERVQHSFAFARYKLRKEHLTKTNGYEPSEERRFFPITDASKIDNILEFNCDERRGGYTSHTHISLYNENSGYVIVVKALSSDFNKRDTHRYPEYLIQYGTKLTSSSSDLHVHLRGLSLY